MKLLHITRSEAAGVRTFLCALLANLDPEEFDISVACPMRGPLVEDVKRLNIRILRMPLEREVSFIPDVMGLIRLCRLLRQERPDGLHLHGAKAGFLGRIAGRLMKVPVIVYTPNNDYLDEPMSQIRRSVLVCSEKLVAALGGQIVSVTRGERESWLRQRICPPANILTIHDGFDFCRAAKLMPKTEAKQQLKIPDEYRVIGFIARLVPQKAAHVYLRAAAAVLRENANVVFLVVGDGPLRASLEDLAAELNITASVRFLGYCEDLSLVYSAMDVSVLTSLYEGLPMVILESMFLGIPVVVSRTHGVAEVIADGCGLITPVGDPSATAEAILEILENPELADRISRKAHTHVVQHFDARQMAARYRAVYLARQVPPAEQQGWEPTRTGKQSAKL